MDADINVTKADVEKVRWKRESFFFISAFNACHGILPDCWSPSSSFWCSHKRPLNLGLFSFHVNLGCGVLVGGWGVSKIRGNPQSYDLSSVLISLITRTINVETNHEPILGGSFRRLRFSLNGFSKKKIDLLKAGADRPASSERAWLLALFLIKR